MKKGTKVQIKDTESMRAWKYANEFGVIIGPDPRGINKDIFAVKLDSGSSLLESKGVHKSHFRIIDNEDTAHDRETDEIIDSLKDGGPRG